MILEPVKGTRVIPGVTNTSLFLLPITGNVSMDLKKYGFLNAYLQDELKSDQYENCIICLFQPDDIVDFDMFVEEEKLKKVNVVDDYDYPGGFSVVVYDLGKDYEDDIEKIMAGKYSKTSKKYKQLIPAQLGRGLIKKVTSIQHLVFTKSDRIKKEIEKLYDIELPEDVEYWEMFDKSQEILKFKHVQHYIEAP